MEGHTGRGVAVKYYVELGGLSRQERKTVEQDWVGSGRKICPRET